MPSRGPASRTGFALLAVLWVMVGVATLALGASLSSRDAVAAAANRASATRAFWIAEDCLARAQAAIDEALAVEGTPDRRDRAWSALDTVVLSSPLLPIADCSLSLRPAGSALDLNAADREMLRRLFAGLGRPDAESLADALLDWRDRDHLTRPSGAENDWYESHTRHAPRNGTLADMRELARVRGFERLAAELDPILSVEPGRVVLPRAPLVVLAALPGMSQEAIGRVHEIRALGRPWTLVELASGLSRAGRDSLIARHGELTTLTTELPDAWLLESRGVAGPLALPISIQVRLVRSGRRAAVVRRRVVR